MLLQCQCQLELVSPSKTLGLCPLLNAVTCCRKNFDKWWKGTWTTVKIPGKGTIYDYFVNFKTNKFTPWTDLVTDIDYDSGVPMTSLFVPTAETSSLRFFLDLMIGLKKPIMFVGGAGVGKSRDWPNLSCTNLR